MAGAVMMGFVLVVVFGVTAYLIGTLVRSIANERRAPMKLWKNFGLSLGFCGLFLITWIAHGVAEWQVFTDEQADHDQPVEVADFVAQMSSATLENWQSEFLQLFSFTVMAAVLIHKGSAESRDSDDQLMAALKRIEDELGTELTLRDKPLRQDDSIHVVPDGGQGWMLKHANAAEPDGYYDTQAQAIDAGRALANKEAVDLVIRAADGTVRDRTNRTGG